MRKYKKRKYRIQVGNVVFLKQGFVTNGGFEFYMGDILVVTRRFKGYDLRTLTGVSDDEWKIASRVPEAWLIDSGMNEKQWEKSLRKKERDEYGQA